MTEAELIEVIAAFNSSAQGWVGLYMTILSAYLITAYMAGKNLAGIQVFIVSVGFIVFASLSTFAAIANGRRILEFSEELRLLNPARDFDMNPFILNSQIGLYSLGIVAALYFMWDIRRPSKQ